MRQGMLLPADSFRRRSGDAHAVLARVRHDAQLVDAADVARRQLERDELAEFRHPQATPLDVDVLPTRRLDVGVRNAVAAHAALAGDVTSSHDEGRERSVRTGDVKRAGR